MWAKNETFSSVVPPLRLVQRLTWVFLRVMSEAETRISMGSNLALDHFLTFGKLNQVKSLGFFSTVQLLWEKILFTKEDSLKFLMFSERKKRFASPVVFFNTVRLLTKKILSRNYFRERTFREFLNFDYTCDKQVLWESAGAFFSARQLSDFTRQLARFTRSWSSGKMLAFQPRGFVFEPVGMR